MADVKLKYDKYNQSDAKNSENESYQKRVNGTNNLFRYMDNSKKGTMPTDLSQEKKISGQN